MRNRVLYTAPWYPTSKKVQAPFIKNHAKAESLLNNVAVLAVVHDGSPLRPHVRIEVGDLSPSFSEVIVFAPSLDLSTPVWLRPLAIIERSFAYFRGYHYIKRHIWKGKNPDICHVNVLTEAAALPWLLQKVRGIPYIITEHWSRYGRSDGHYPLNKFHSFVTKTFVKDAFAVCPVSKNLESAMKKHGLVNDRFRLVGNVVDNSIFYLRDQKQSGHPYRFCHVSWLRDKAKNISGILRTLQQLQKVETDWEMTFVGEGNDRTMLESTRDMLGLEERVHFVGTLRGADLAGFLRRQDCMVMFSDFENQPVSILEALACGLPVIASAVGDIPRLLADGRGVCVGAGDETQLLEALRFAMAGQWKSTERVRGLYIASNFDYLIIAQQFEELYDEACCDDRYLPA